MTFLYPIGLLGLIGIPILILIYIIKNKYTEQIVSSTYLWTLSEKFLKRKRPVSKLVGIISLILQLLAIAVLSFTIAHPIFTLKNAAKDYYFFMDTSGSMSIETDGVSGFDAGKEKISLLIDEAVEGSSFTLVAVSDGAEVIYEKRDREQAKLLLSELDYNHEKDDYINALTVAQEYFNEDPAAAVYLITDRTYSTAENVEIINVLNDVKNVGLSRVTWEKSSEGIVVSGFVTSYVEGGEVEIEFYLNGSDTPEKTLTCIAKTDIAEPFEQTVLCETFETLTVRVKGEDSLKEDNECILVNIDTANEYKTLLVSDNPFFINAALNATSSGKIDVQSTKDYSGEGSYGLYIFDTFSPAELPRDGAVWIINPVSSISGSGFSVQGEVEIENGGILTKSSSTSTMVKNLLKGVEGDEIHISDYVKCGLNDGFTTLFTMEGQPIVFAGVNTYGNREVVFCFDLHSSDLPLTLDYVRMVDNFLEYSFPPVLNQTNYTVGDTLEVNVIANCDSIRVDTPLGNVEYLDVSSPVGELHLSEAGVYEITLMVADAPHTYSVYSAFPEEESNPKSEAESFGLSGEADPDGKDGIYDNLMIFFICLAVLFTAEWMVYCYEKYQLR